MSATLNQRRSTINAALKEFAPAARALRQNTDELVRLLQSIEDLGGVTSRVVNASRDDLLSTLQKMGPIFEELNALGDELGPGIDTLVEFGGLIDRGVPTDYLNTHLHFQLELSLGVPGTLAAPLATPDPDGRGGLLGTPLVPPDLLAPPGSSTGSKGAARWPARTVRGWSLMRRAIPLKHKLGASGLAAVLILTVVYLYTGVLGGSVGARPLHVTVVLEETGGLYVGSGVSYRGVRVGSVSSIELAGNQAEADLT